MTLEGAIKCLKLEFEFAKLRPWIKNPLAYALYQVWKAAGGEEKSEQEWISVEDGLPNVNTNKSGYESIGVIVCIEGYRKSKYRIYERSCVRGKTVYRWKYPYNRISDEKITHWMPLPEKPKGANHENE